MILSVLKMQDYIFEVDNYEKITQIMIKNSGTP